MPELTPSGPHDNDMRRMSATILREILHAQTWADMVSATEVLAAVRARYESMDVEHKLMEMADEGLSCFREAEAVWPGEGDV